MKSFNQAYNYDSTKQELYQNPHNHHQMYISNSNHFNNVHHVQIEPSLIDPNNCQPMAANVFIIQPQYNHYDYTTSTSADYAHNVHTTNNNNTTNPTSSTNATSNTNNNNDYNATLPIMDVDSFVANLSNLEEVHYCIDSSNQHHQHQPNLLLPTQHVNSLENLNQNGTNANIVNQNKQNNYEDYSLINSNMNHLNYSISNGNIVEMNANASSSDGSGKLNEKMCKVDILNQVILSATNITGLVPKTNNFDFNRNHYNETNQFHQFNSNPHNNNSNNSIKTKKLNESKPKYKQKDSKIFCMVCAGKSSGYHYGAHTCEACKLFFRRTEKLIRKTGFNECKTTNCKITYENRANCSACRYKKCIAVGMSMSRSRFGRHTEKLSTNYAPTNTESLNSLLANLKLKYKNQNYNLEFLNNVVLDFYFNSLNLLAIKNNQDEDLEADNNSQFQSQNDNSSSFNSSGSFTNNSTLSELSSILKTSKSTPETSSTAPLAHIPSNESIFTQNRTIVLPDSVIILFCILFDINIGAYSSLQKLKIENIKTDFCKFLTFTQDRLFQKKTLSEMLRIGLFIKIMRLLLESSIIKDDLHDKRITDLMRSEFAYFKGDHVTSASNSSTSSFTTDFEKSNDYTSSTNDSLGQSNLVLIFTNINHLLFKHMTPKELDHFVFKQCFDSEF